MARKTNYSFEKRQKELAKKKKKEEKRLRKQSTPDLNDSEAGETGTVDNAPQQNTEGNSPEE